MELEVTFVTAVSVKQLRVLLQQGNWQCGDGQRMECGVLTGSGQTVQCEEMTVTRNQRDAVQQYVYWQLQYCSTCFGRFLRPSSGALETIVVNSTSNVLLCIL